MKPKLHVLFIVLALLAGVHLAAAQTAQFFRIAGPATTKIITFRPDGSLVWTNARPGTNYTIQTLSSLAGGPNWVDYVQLPVTSARNTNQIIDPNPPAGMVFIPAGSFTMGDTLDGNVLGDATPTNVMVSAFYMDKNLVSYSQWQTVYSAATNSGYGFDYAGTGTAGNQPVQTVDWYDVVKWSNARSQQRG
jgi:formylglycine-generating enzyme required for sulfatase activity